MNDVCQPIVVLPAFSAAEWSSAGQIRPRSLIIASIFGVMFVPTFGRGFQPIT
jgi:hypothetical protein